MSYRYRLRTLLAVVTVAAVVMSIWVSFQPQRFKCEVLLSDGTEVPWGLARFKRVVKSDQRDLGGHFYGGELELILPPGEYEVEIDEVWAEPRGGGFMARGDRLRFRMKVNAFKRLPEVLKLEPRDTDTDWPIKDVQTRDGRWIPRPPRSPRR